MDEQVEKPKKSKKFLRRLRNILISAIIMLGIMFAAGAGYVWYMGQNTPQYVEKTVASDTGYKEIKHIVNNDPNQNVGVALGSISSPATPGSDVSMSIRTNPYASCKITVEYNKDTLKTMNMNIPPMTDSGLVAKDADDWGSVSWSWHVPENATLGKWYARAICSKGSKWANVVADLMIANG